MSRYIPNRRDPLTQRVARSVRETVCDPWDYSEGPREPQLVDVTRSFPHAARERAALARLRRRPLAEAPRCYGNCAQGRRPCQMPGVCTLRPMAAGDEYPTVPAPQAEAPATRQANACSTRWFWLPLLGLLAAVALVWATR